MEKLYAIAALAALAQETRLDIFRLLVEAGADGMPAGQIGEKLGLPSATLSFHLNQLKHAHLVKFRRESRSLIYSAEYTVMNGLLAYLTENCCQGDAAACGLASCESATAKEERFGDSVDLGPIRVAAAAACCTTETPQGERCAPKVERAPATACCGPDATAQA